MSKYAIPSDTERVLAGTGARLLDECRNFGLLFHRYVPLAAIDGEGKEQERKEWYKALVGRSTPSDDLNALINATVGRWNAMAKAGNAKRFKMNSTSRLIVGLGGKGPLEIGITLDPVTGLPFIPGSALKGVARSYALYVLAEAAKIKLDGTASDNDTLKNFDEALLKGTYDALGGAADYRLIFGTLPDAEIPSSGKAIFYDAVFLGRGGPIFELDVMTPHFKGWYNSGNSGKPSDPPHDADSPNPVTFLTVGAGAQFAFAVGWRGEPHPTAHQFARELLEVALQDFGIGSKTAAGYGAFTPPK
ncbi:MAG: type III-B CRISPR module RAMP protein Cmr6 [Anaerolineae bacterium]|nr:type III-B CRISPR module RAMP protein Cmr6 [Anaerolineae bacterium]